MWGAYAIVDFKNCKRVYFWIYPLGWSKPRVRIIAKIGEQGNVVFPEEVDADIRG